MKVLLSGSSGMIGRALGASLRDDGHRVVALVRRGPGSPAGGAGVEWNPPAGTLDGERLRALGPFDAVVHLAGAGLGDRRWTDARKREIHDSRIGSTRTLVRALLGLDPVPPVLVSASAIGYYGDRGDELLDEDSTPGVGFLAKLCRSWEHEAAQAASATRVVHLRTGIVLSRTGGALAKQLPLFRRGLGGRLGDGRQYLSWITLADEVGVIRRAIDDDRLSGPLNATSPEPVTNAEFTAALGRALHRPALLAVPRPALSLALGPEMASEMVLASQRVVPAKLKSVQHRFVDPELDRALASVLGSGA